MQQPALTATLSPDRDEVRLVKGAWHGAFPVERLPDWLRFYRGLRDRRAGRFARHYAADVAELERVQAEVMA